MSIDTVFIPCAGKGTRMGEIGKKLAKPLWPLFEVTLLEFQIRYYKRLGFERFIINTHHLYEQFEIYGNEIEILYEPTLLGSGGSLHNIKINNPELSKILISNPDIVFDLDESQWKAFLRKAHDNSVDNLLIGLPCRSGELYNELIIKEKFLDSVAPAPDRDYLTYSGIGIIDLKSFPYVQGESSFFHSVANKSLNNTAVVEVGERKDYWDFGTLNLYVTNILKLMDKQSCTFAKRLIDMQVIDPHKTYQRDKVISLGEMKISLNENGQVGELFLEN